MVLVPWRKKGLEGLPIRQKKQEGRAIEATRNGTRPLLFGQIKVLQ